MKCWRTLGKQCAVIALWIALWALLAAAVRQPLLLPDPAAVPELYAPAMSRAILLLSQAKSLHDQLEAVYKPYMDFKSLDVFTRSHIDSNIDRALSQAGAKP